jgi:hypothetical protein
MQLHVINARTMMGGKATSVGCSRLEHVTRAMAPPDILTDMTATAANWDNGDRHRKVGGTRHDSTRQHGRISIDVATELMMVRKVGKIGKRVKIGKKSKNPKNRSNSKNNRA